MFKFLSNDGLNIEIRQLLNKLQPLKVQNLPKQNSQTRQRRKNSNLYCAILIQHSGTLCDNCSELLLTRLIAMMCRLAELLTTQHISIHSLFMFIRWFLFIYLESASTGFWIMYADFLFLDIWTLIFDDLAWVFSVKRSSLHFATT